MIGVPVSVDVAAGAAAAVYVLPSATAAGSYTIQAAYSGTSDYLGSPGSNTLTIHVLPPTSTVATLPPFSTGTFTVSWSGSDAEGIGIASYSVYYSDNGGDYMPLLTNTTLTSTTFTGLEGHTYGFYSVATDNLGNQQATPTAAQRLHRPDPGGDKCCPDVRSPLLARPMAKR